MGFDFVLTCCQFLDNFHELLSNPVIEPYDMKTKTKSRKLKVTKSKDSNVGLVSQREKRFDRPPSSSTAVNPVYDRGDGVNEAASDCGLFSRYQVRLETECVGITKQSNSPLVEIDGDVIVRHNHSSVHEGDTHEPPSNNHNLLSGEAVGVANESTGNITSAFSSALRDAMLEMKDIRKEMVDNRADVRA